MASLNKVTLEDLWFSPMKTLEIYFVLQEARAIHFQERRILPQGTPPPTQALALD